MIRALLLAAALVPAAARAAPLRLPLGPGDTVVTFRAYAFGVLPLDGRFSRFSGVLVIDPARPGACHVDLSVDVASLQMPDPGVRADVLSGDMLDAAAFPRLGYRGACDGGGIEGALTMHGVTRELHLAIVNRPPRYTAEARLRRRDWGITGRPVLAGATVRIRVSTTISRGPEAQAGR